MAAVSWYSNALILPFALSALAGWTAWQISDLSSSLASRGETAVATITNKRILGDNGASRSGQTPLSIEFNIYYKFTTHSGKVKSKSDVLHKLIYDRYQIGQKVKVRYLRDDPNFNEIVAGRKKSENATAAAGMSIFFAVIGFLAIGLVNILSFKAKEPDEGQSVPTALTESDNSKRGSVPD